MCQCQQVFVCFHSLEWIKWSIDSYTSDSLTIGIMLSICCATTDITFRHSSSAIENHTNNVVWCLSTPDHFGPVFPLCFRFSNGISMISVVMLHCSHLFGKAMQFIHVLKYPHCTQSKLVANHSSHCVRLWLTKVGFCHFSFHERWNEIVNLIGSFAVDISNFWKKISFLLLMERALNAYLLYFIIDSAIHSVPRQIRTMHDHHPSSYILFLSIRNV